MVLWRGVRAAGAGVAFLILIGAAPAQRNSAELPAMRGIEQGQWQLKERDGGAVRNLCVKNTALLLQLRHGGTQCSHFVIENAAKSATIRYTCPGHGYGRTTISVETPRLVRVDTQGVLDGAPFASEIEGRRTGACN